MTRRVPLWSDAWRGWTMTINQTSAWRKPVVGRRTVLRLRLLRTEAGLHIEDLARIAEVHKSTISKIETKAVRCPSPKTLRKLADALEYQGDPLELLEHVDVCP